MTRHDRLFKLLLGTFFADFVELFFPELSVNLDRASLQPQDKEVFTDLTEGQTHEADLVFKAKFQNSDSFFLLHVENQAQRKPEFPRRMFTYFARLHEKYALAVYPIVVFSFDQPAAPQPSVYEVVFPNLEVLRFRFETVQLNRLDWNDYAQKLNPVAAAFMAKMRIAPDDRWLVEFKSLELLSKLNLPPARAKLISEFFDTYIRPTALEKAKINAELRKLEPEQREKIMEVIETSWSKEAREEGIRLGRQEGLKEGLKEGLEEGRREGIQKGLEEGQRLGAAGLLALQLTKRFGPIEKHLVDQIQQLDRTQLERLGEDFLGFSSVAGLVNWLKED